MNNKTIEALEELTASFQTFSDRIDEKGCRMTQNELEGGKGSTDTPKISTALKRFLMLQLKK